MRQLQQRSRRGHGRSAGNENDAPEGRQDGAAQRPMDERQLTLFNETVATVKSPCDHRPRARAEVLNVKHYRDDTSTLIRCLTCGSRWLVSTRHDLDESRTP